MRKHNRYSAQNAVPSFSMIEIGIWFKMNKRNWPYPAVILAKKACGCVFKQCITQ